MYGGRYYSSCSFSCLQLYIHIPLKWTCTILINWATLINSRGVENTWLSYQKPDPESRQRWREQQHFGYDQWKMVVRLSEVTVTFSELNQIRLFSLTQTKRCESLNRTNSLIMFTVFRCFVVCEHFTGAFRFQRICDFSNLLISNISSLCLLQN